MHEVFAQTSCIFASCGYDGFIVILFLPNPTGPFRAENEAVPLLEFPNRHTEQLSLQICLYSEKGGVCMDELYLFLEEEEGVTVVEIILVLLVLIALVALFKTQLTSLVNSILGKVTTNAGKI